MPKKDRYLVLGNPIAHSKSPLIHALFAEQTGQAMEYEGRLIELGTFDQSVRAMQKEGIRGANVTVPFKQQAWQIADELSERARHAGAVNTLVFGDDGVIFADNTDGAGLVKDLVHNHQQAIAGKRILILGAGGAVRGILKPLIDERPQAITIANRTIEKAELLKTAFVGQFDISASGFDRLAGQQFDLVINGTSLGLKGKVAPVPDGILAENAVAYDMMYGDGSQPFQHWAASQGAGASYDGLGMLVEQAAESFYLWRGVQPDTVSVIRTLNN